MRPVVRLSVRAQKELDQNLVWWAQHRSEEQAIRWYECILAAIRGLASNPFSHAVAWESTYSPVELREMPFGIGSRPSHRVLYSVLPNVVLIVCIRHGAQDDLSADEISGLTR